MRPDSPVFQVPDAVSFMEHLHQILNTGATGPSDCARLSNTVRLMVESSFTCDT